MTAFKLNLPATKPFRLSLCSDMFCWQYVQEFVGDQSLFKRINLMLAECEQKADLCKQICYKSGFCHSFVHISWLMLEKC